MSVTQGTKRILSESKVIPDVLPDDVNLSYDLSISWPDTTFNTSGQELGREATQPEPKLSISPAPSSPLDNLVLIMTDPDLMMNNDTYFGQVRHWLVTNLSTSANGALIKSEGDDVSPYIGPAPLPNYLYERPHRYVFILARAPGNVHVSAADLQELQKPYTAAVSGKQEVHDLKDRWGFNAQKFLEMKECEVLAVTFVRVHGTAKSAAANAAMMGQAAMNKILGN